MAKQVQTASEVRTPPAPKAPRHRMGRWTSAEQPAMHHWGEKVSSFLHRFPSDGVHSLKITIIFGKKIARRQRFWDVCWRIPPDLKTHIMGSSPVQLKCLLGYIVSAVGFPNLRTILISEILSPKISMCIVHSDWFPVINSMLGKYLHVHPKLYKRETRSMTMVFCDHEVLHGIK